MSHFPRGYGVDDVARWVPEPPKTVYRSDFARDRARVLHSSALRRLGGKTQVVGAATDDFARTRLTHSMEVAQVGRELGAALGCDPDIVDAACLAHDVGHPPFGHHGEMVLNDIASSIGGFEGNAQSLRLLTRLEPKVHREVDGECRPVGLNLTRATLDACIKYPWLPGEGPNGTAKYGVYEDDADVFRWLRDGVPADRRCVETQVMDLADDIAYCVHDVEDAIACFWLDPAILSESAELDRVVDAGRRYATGKSESIVAAGLRRLRQLPMWPDGFDGSRRALAGLKDLTSHLIGRFSWSAREATVGRYGNQPLTRYSGGVELSATTHGEIAALKGIAAVYVMQNDQRQAVYAWQEQVIREIAKVLLETGADFMDTPFAEDYDHARTEGERLRVVVDQIASLSDLSAADWYGRITGKTTVHRG